MIIGNPITLGGGKAPAPAGRSDVNFYDYDGSIVASYTAADFANLSALPKNPTHDGLTAQGWNWSLADAKAYAASYGKLDVGQMYITDDGKTRIYIKLEEGRLAPYLGIAINGTATVEWGDGQTSTVTGSDTFFAVNTQHTYASAGEYVIKIAVSGSMALRGGSGSTGSVVLWNNSTTGNLNRVYQNAIRKVEVGTNTAIEMGAFSYCHSLEFVVIPGSVTSIGDKAFGSSESLTFVVIPNGVETIGGSAFARCYGLASVVIPPSVTSIGTYAFQNCLSLASVVIPGSVTSIGLQVFYGCESRTFVVIPNGVTSIGAQAFQNCYGLSSIKFTSTTPPTVANANAWSGIPTDCIIYVPRGSLSAYTSASNYPSSSTYTYVEYDL